MKECVACLENYNLNFNKEDIERIQRNKKQKWFLFGNMDWPTFGVMLDLAYMKTYNQRSDSCSFEIFESHKYSLLIIILRTVLGSFI